MKFNSTENITNLITKVLKPARNRAIRLAANDAFEIEKIFYGYITVPLTVIIVPVNILLIFLFVRGKFHTSAHGILIAMALLQCVTAISRSILSVYFYILGYAEEYIQYSLCVPYVVFQRIIPALAVTWYLYLTALLGIQRCIVVTFPYSANRIFSRKKTVIYIFVLGILATSIFVPGMIDAPFDPITVNSFLQPNTTILSCRRSKPIVNVQVKSTLLTVLGKILPIALLVILNTYLVYKLKKVRDWRRKQGGGQEQQVKRANSSSDRMSLVTSCVIFAVLVVDFPALVVHLYFSYSENVSCRVYALDTLLAIISPIDMILFFSTWVIYCCLSSRFRQYVLVVFHWRKKEDFKERYRPESTTMTARSSDAIHRQDHVHDSTLSL
jgi:hypothetical protein